MKKQDATFQQLRDELDSHQMQTRTATRSITREKDLQGNEALMKELDRRMDEKVNAMEKRILDTLTK